MKKLYVLLLMIIIVGAFVFTENLTDRSSIINEKVLKKTSVTSKNPSPITTQSETKEAKKVIVRKQKAKITLKASNFDAAKIQIFNKNIDYLEQPSLNDLVVVYRELDQSELKNFISKIEQFISQKNYIKRHNAKELSEQESLFFASLTHRLSVARLVKLQKRIARMGEIDDEGS